MKYESSVESRRHRASTVERSDTGPRKGRHSGKAAGDRGAENLQCRPYENHWEFPFLTYVAPPSPHQGIRFTLQKPNTNELFQTRTVQMVHSLPHLYSIHGLPYVKVSWYKNSGQVFLLTWLLGSQFPWWKIQRNSLTVHRKMRAAYRGYQR